MYKFSLLLLVLCLVCFTKSVPAPAPTCQPHLIPEMIPVTVGDTFRFDMERLADGLSIKYEGAAKQHIKITPKFTFKGADFISSFNFTAAKITDRSNRFIGIVTSGAYTLLVVGVYDEDKGVTISFQKVVEDVPNMQCFDVDEVLDEGNAYAIVDCAVFIRGLVLYNEFQYVNLATQAVSITHVSDAFVSFNFLSSRKIEIIHDPFTRMSYLLRVIVANGVDTENRKNTYAEVFLLYPVTRPQLLQVIDYTYLRIPSLEIGSYQVYRDFIYILAVNKGIYQISLGSHQALKVTGFMELKQDISQFRIDQIGFNDELNVVATNGNTVYQFYWDVYNAPVLTNKYTLFPNSQVDQIFADSNFVVVQAKVSIDDRLQRKIWVFSKRTPNYNLAFAVFDSPMVGPSLLQWQGHDSTVHLFRANGIYSIRMSLPYLQLSPKGGSFINTTQTYTITATSSYEGAKSEQCPPIKINMTYIGPTDYRIINSGFYFNQKQYIDTPDEAEIQLGSRFFGPNLTYSVAFENSSSAPKFYVNKQHKAEVLWPRQIDSTKIVYYEMFTEILPDEPKPRNVFGLIQTKDSTIFLVYYVRCRINLMDEDETHHLSCIVISTNSFQLGAILMASQMFDPTQRRIAIIFEKAPYTAYVYWFWQTGFGYFGRKVYSAQLGNRLTSVAIQNGLLYCVLEFAKRVQIYRLEDIHDPSGAPRNAVPISVLTAENMGFFNVRYFAPVDVKLSRFHEEVMFLKTKVGLLAININQQGFPDLLFNIATLNEQYDFEVNHDHLMIITQTDHKRYSFEYPLRRSSPPYMTHQLDKNFTLQNYNQLNADRFFYLVADKAVYVANPYALSTSVFFTQVITTDTIVSVDAVNLVGRELLFIRTSKELIVYVLTENPTAKIIWEVNQTDFNVSLSCENAFAKSNVLKQSYNVVDRGQTVVTPSPSFDQEHVRKIGHLETSSNNATFTYNVTVNDSDWFSGSVFGYEIKCPSCGDKIKLSSHIEKKRDVLASKAIHDMKISNSGVFVQQSYNLMKTFAYSDDIEWIQRVPVQTRGEICTKTAVPLHQDYALSFCENGLQVNVYVTSLISEKPFTLGPFKTDAKAVNSVDVVGEIVMLVDNDDDPFSRSGGVYLYLFNEDAEDEEFLTFLDYIDDADLMFNGFSGQQHIASADLHHPQIIDKEYRLFVTEAMTGSIFIFTFELSPDRQEIIYISRQRVDLAKVLPPIIKAPTPLRVMTVSLNYYIQREGTVEYYLLLTNSNWNHIEISITLNRQDKLIDYSVNRIYERIPWRLQNTIKFVRGYFSNGYFAVNYVDYDSNSQIIAVYPTPVPHFGEKTDQQHIPVVRMLGCHYVNNTDEIAYSFSNLDSHRMLVVDTEGQNIIELGVERNLNLQVKDLSQPENVTIVAYNPFGNFTFQVQVSFNRWEDDPVNQLKVQIVWIVIMAIGLVMIIGLIIIFFKQRRSVPLNEARQSLLTDQNSILESQPQNLIGSQNDQ